MSVLLIALLALAAAPLLTVAGAQPPGATPEASPVTSGEGWQVTDVRALDVEGRGLVLSPDGRWLAGIGPDSTPCFWDVETLTPSCADERLPLVLNDYLPSMTWAPDSSAVVFSLDVIVRLYDSDIYIFERESGALTNLTDDGYEGDILSAPGPIDIDISPTWSPDGQQIAFVRTIYGGDVSPTAILRVDRDGGQPVNVATLSFTEPWLAWLPMYWLPDDTLVYARSSNDREDPAIGIWRVGIDGTAPPEMLVPGAMGSDIPSGAVADLDPASGTMSIYSTYLLEAQSQQEPVYWLGDLADGTTMPLPVIDTDTGTVLPASAAPSELLRDSLAFPNGPAALSPDGTTAFVTYRSLNREYALAMVDVASGEVTLLVPLDSGVEVRPIAAQWAGDDTILVQGGDGPVLITLAPAP